MLITMVAFAVLDAEERHQRQNAALPVIVGAHDHGDIFDRGGDQQRPDDQREHADRRRRRGASRPFERGFQGVERAGADVAVDDAERAQHQRVEAAFRRAGCAVSDRCRGCHCWFCRYLTGRNARRSSGVLLQNTTARYRAKIPGIATMRTNRRLHNMPTGIRAYSGRFSRQIDLRRARGPSHTLHV